MTWETVLLGIGILAAIIILAYIYKSQKDFLKLVLQEKVDFINKAVPILQGIMPNLPPQYRDMIGQLIDVLQVTKTINEALLQAPIWGTYKSYILLKQRHR